jgi:hypothetical protein
MNHKIGKYEIKLKEKLGWYDQEVIKNEMISGAKIDNTGLKGFDGSAMLRMKLKLWELAIEEIKEGDKVIPFSEDWVKGLDSDEGNQIDAAIEELDKKK